MTHYTQAAREWVRPLSEAAELTAAEIERIKASMPDVPYPVELQAKRRYAFVAQVRNGGRAQVIYVDESAMLETRAAQVEADLRDPFIRKEQALELLDELAEIETRLNKE